ncbi:MAG: caspase family protein [Micropruina sp.]|uniref:hypothetical protein n=1 Tax=Micropruina sp. TaxID=2737536 RepID=UPI0039E4DB4A
MGRYLACVVGVAAPDPFRFRGERFAFGTAAGVDGDVDFYTGLLYEEVPSDRLVFAGARTRRHDTTRKALLSHLAHLAGDARAGDTLVLVLVGHGFQVRDNPDRPDEADGFDEVFAAADQPIVDDDFAGLWATMRPDANVIVFADTCSSHTIGIMGGRSDEHINSDASKGPSRLSLAASMPFETAASEPARVGSGSRGIFSQALEVAWQGERPATYLDWFRATATHVGATRPKQHPQLLYIGPDDELLNRRPFT